MSISRSKSVPLPNDITAGTYIVVDQFGHSERMTITSAELSLASDIGRDQYIVRDGVRRWHFIRLQLPDDLKIAQPIGAQHLPILH